METKVGAGRSTKARALLLTLRYSQQVKLIGSGREEQGEHYARLAQGIPSCSNAGCCTNDKHFLGGKIGKAIKKKKKT